jgi:hypothetical protein
MWSMNGRPCNPGSDLRALWQTLLGDIPFPQCGLPDQVESPQDAAPRAEPPPAAGQPPVARLSDFRDLL